MRLNFLFMICLLQHVAFGQEISFGTGSGFYRADFDLVLSSNSNSQIHYTLDGTDPTRNSPEYTQAIKITDRSNEPNTIADIPTNPPTTWDFQLWIKPKVVIPKSRIVKAALFQNGQQVSPVFYEEYFIGDSLANIQLPIFSIVIDSADLFDYEKGIYVPGRDFDNNPNTWQPGNYYERGDEWERIMQVSFYENEKQVLKQTAQVEIHGGGSRIYPCKSLRLSAKNSLGNRFFDYSFFKDRPWDFYKRMVLRNGGQDWTKTIFKDALFHSLLKNQQIETQATLPTVVFINGSYWGIHNLRERYDKYYFENYHDDEIEEIDFLEIAMEFIAKEGDVSDYEKMNESLNALDLSNDEDYEHIAQQIDIANFIDNHISKTYGGGRDWSGNNERLWRAKSKGNKWRWVAKDYDDVMEDITYDAYQHATNDVGEDWPNPEWSTRLFRHLMKNEKFSNRYRERLEYHLSHTFSATKVITAIDSLAAIYRPEMQRQIDRWNYPSSLSEWEQSINDMKTFAKERASFLLDNFNSFFPPIYENPTDISMSPNPASDIVFIDLPASSTTRIKAMIYTTNGQLKTEWLLSNENQNSLSLSNFTKGTYFVHFFWNEQQIVKKLLVQ